MLDSLLKKIGAAIHRRRLDEELEEEMRSHLEMAADEYVSRGLTGDDAMRAARRDFGRVERAREGHRDARRIPGVGDLLRDVRISTRGLRRRPGFTAVAVATLALGVAATTTVYAVVDGVLLRPLPYQEPSTLVAAGALDPGAEWIDREAGLQNLAPISFPNFLDFRDRARSFEQLAALMLWEDPVTVGDAPASTVRVGGVTMGVFETLGAAPALGRSLIPSDYLPVLPEAVVITHESWQRRFGGEPNVVGRSVEVEGSPMPMTIVGVLSPEFTPPEAIVPVAEIPELWLPIQDHDRDSWIMASRRERELHLLGRLAAGATVEQARLEAEHIAAELAAEHPIDNVDRRTGSPFGIGVNDLHAQTVGTNSRPLGLFLGAAGLLLLLATMNAATLLLARALDRTGEFGVRMALGAGRGRVVRLLATEAIVLAIAAGAVGVLLAYGGIGVFRRYAPPSMPRLGAIDLDMRVLAMAAAFSLGAGIVIGILPALRLTGQRRWSRLQRGGSSYAEPSPRLRGALVSAQIAVAVVLLTGAGLLFGSFVRMGMTDELGFDADGLIAMGVEAKGATGWNFQSHWISWDVLLEELRAVPGVESVAGTSNPPFQSPKWMPRLLLPGDPAETVRSGIAGYAITPGYFATMGTRLLQGRDFQPTDGPDAERVALVNETFVRTQLGGADAIGSTISWAAGTEWSPGDEWIPPEEWLTGAATPLRIVGVVEDVVQTRVGEGSRSAIYIPYTQSRPLTPRVVVRTALPPEALFADLRGAAARFNPLDQDPVLELSRIGPPEGANLWFQVLLVGAFAIVATLLAAAGLYGSLSHSVGRRQRELGIRMALGANRSGVLGMVLRQGMRLSAIGLAAGMVAALLVTRVLTGFLYGIDPNDPVTLLAVGAVMMLVSALACVTPARRATAVDPAKVLKAE